MGNGTTGVRIDRMGKSLAFRLKKISIITACREGNTRESNNGFDRSLEIKRGFDANLPWLAIDSRSAREDLPSNLNEVILNAVGLDDFANSVCTVTFGNGREIRLQFRIRLLQAWWIGPKDFCNQRGHRLLPIPCPSGYCSCV